jgi:hypothetical protein
MINNLKEIDSEELYQSLKQQIKKKKLNSYPKNTIINEYLYTQEEIDYAKKCITFDDNNISGWMQAKFDIYLDEKKFISPKIISNFSPGIISQKRLGIDISNLIYRSNEGLNYQIVNNIIKSTVILKGESEFWIFLRCKEQIEENTVAILFSKYDNSDIVMMSIGFFVNTNINNFQNQEKLTFRTLQTMQLFKSYDIKNLYNKTSNSCLIKVIVVDNGEETVKVSAWLNEGDAENKLVGNYFKPIVEDSTDLEKHSSFFDVFNKNYKIMIAGSGEKCKITHFSCETCLKENFDYLNLFK